MLQSIHHFTQSRLARVIITLVALSFVVWGIEAYLTTNRTSHKTLVSVNNQNIHAEAVNALANRIARSQGTPFESLSPQVQDLFKQVALNHLISEVALTHALGHLGLAVTQDQAVSTIKGLPQFQIDGQFSEKMFYRALYALGLPVDEFYHSMENSLCAEQWFEGLMASEFALPNEAAQAYHYQKQTRDGAYVIVNDQDAKAPVITTAAIKTYYDNHQQQFQRPPRVRLQYVLLDKNTLASQVSVSDAEIERYFDKHLAARVIPARWRIALISTPLPAKAKRQDIEKAIAELANIKTRLLQKKIQYQNLDPRLYDVEVKWISADRYDVAMIDRLKTMSDQQITDPFRADYRMAIMQRLGHVAEQRESFVAQKEAIRQALQKRKIAALFSERKDKLADLSYTHPQDLNTAAIALNLSVRTLPFDLTARPLPRLPNSSSQHQADQWLASFSQVTQAAFSDDVLKEHNNSDIIQLDEDHIAVIRVQSYHLAALAPLNEVSQQIAEMLKHQALHQRALLTAQNILKKAHDQGGLSALAAREHLKLIALTAITLKDKVAPSVVHDKLFSLPSPQKAKGSQWAIVPLAGGFAVVELRAIHYPPTANAQQQHAMQDELTDLYGKSIISLWQKQVFAQAKIKH